MQDEFEIEYREECDVVLVDSMGSDERICQAARVSQKGAQSLETEESARLIEYLMGNRHGSPFEHGSMTWLITAPIFVWREFHRHRMASYNEESSRWKQLEPVFYVPGSHRPAFKAEGSRTGDYMNLPAGNDFEIAQFEAFRDAMKAAQRALYGIYDGALKEGIAREVARQILPVSIYSSCYVTMNPRGLMNFLSLRTADTALYEIRMLAKQMEADFQTVYPLTHAAWVENGRQAP